VARSWGQTTPEATQAAWPNLKWMEQARNLAAILGAGRMLKVVVRRVKDQNHQDALFPESKHQGVGAHWCPQIPTPTPATPASWSTEWAQR
jgi:hypothetical protein